VEVKPSTIAGRGLFARAPRRATHVWAPNKSVYYDALNASKSVAGMANRAPRGGRNNAKITGGGKIKALAQIPQGREVLVGYGAGYRL